MQEGVARPVARGLDAEGLARAPVDDVHDDDVVDPVPEEHDLDLYVADARTRIAQALERTGLTAEESQAMVNTWKRQWFRTPGVRLLYVMPQLWTDSSIPLAIEPRPTSRSQAPRASVRRTSPRRSL